MAKLDLVAPWTTYYRQLQALFIPDDQVKVFFDVENETIKVFVNNQTKANALTILLPTTKTFGNVTIKVTIIPVNEITTTDVVQLDPKNFNQLFTYAFKGNKAVTKIEQVASPFAIGFTYVVFAKEVVQFFNDDISDIHGLCNTLYQDIAKTVFEQHPGVFFCTDLDLFKSDIYLGKPLGEWP